MIVFEARLKSNRKYPLTLRCESVQAGDGSTYYSYGLGELKPYKLDATTSGARNTIERARDDIRRWLELGWLGKRYEILIDDMGVMK